MTIKVAAFCTYLTNVDVGWRPSDYAASNFVKAVKGKPLVGSHSDVPVKGTLERLADKNREDAASWFGTWAWDRLREEYPAGPVVLVPIPTSSAVIGFTRSYPALRLAHEAAARSGGRAVVSDVLRWTRPLPPAHQGGVRDPQSLLVHLTATASPTPGTVVLVDDVLTKGGHLLAAGERLRVLGADRPRLAIVAGRTVLEPPDDPFATVVERLDEIEPDLPGYRTYRVSTNGRGVGWRTHHGFCSLWVPDERRGDFTGMVNRCRARHPSFEGDFRWKDVSESNAAFHVDLIDDFFADNRFMAHMIVTAASPADDSAARAADPHIRRCLSMLHQMKLRFFASGAEPKGFHIRVAFPDDEPDVALRVREVEAAIGSDPTVTVHDQRWAGNPFVQLADLLLTAVMADWESASLNEGQRAVRDAIVRGLGWEEWGDLRGDTFMHSWKVNIWTYHNPRIGLDRPVESRPVKERTPYRAEWSRRRR